MRINRPRRIDRDTAERLLDGRPLGPNAGHDALADLLAAAAAPAVDGELAGEGAAITAFREARLGSVRQPRRGRMATTKRASAFSAKAIGTAIATTAICGVSLAAATGHLPGVRGGGSVAPHSHGSPAATEGPSNRGSAPSAPGDVAPGTSAARHGTIGLCRAYDAAGKTERGRMLASPPFTALVSEAGGRAKVTAYCATVRLDERRNGGHKRTTVPAHPFAPEKTGGTGLGHGNGAANGQPKDAPTSTGAAHGQPQGDATSGHTRGSR